MKKGLKAFTLLELIVVVFIIGIMGSIVFKAAIRKETAKKNMLTALTLPQSMRETFKDKGEVELFCINKCQECYTMQNNQIKAYPEAISLGKEVEVYKLDSDNHFVQQEELGRVKDNKICLKFHLYENGSSTQMVIQNSEGIYYLPSYFGSPQKVEDMESAKKLWIKEKYDISDSGAFY